MAFAGSLKSVMENAHDNEQMVQVGYRDRIAHVRLAHDEGGLNLKMPADRVTLLATRGEVAGEALRNASRLLRTRSCRGRTIVGFGIGSPWRIFSSFSASSRTVIARALRRLQANRALRTS